MASINQVTLLGRVGQAPQYSEPKQGLTVARFNLATTRKVNGQDETQWHRVTIFNKGADFVEKYVHKGDMVAVLGELKYSKYKKDGVEMERAEILANNVQLVQTTQSAQPKNEADDLPSDF
jgi:single-strand DNA-binding protein